MPKVRKSKQKDARTLERGPAAFPLESVWFDPSAPVGSALRQLLGLSGRIFWVEFRPLRKRAGKKVLSLGRVPQGLSTEKLLLPVTGADGEALAELKLIFGPPGEVSVDFREEAQRVAKELGERWPV